MIEIEPPKQNREKRLEKRTNSVLPTLKSKWKTEKLKGSYPIHLSDKLSNSRLILEVTKNYGEFMLILNQIKTYGQSIVFHNIWVSILQQRIQML